MTDPLDNPVALGVEGVRLSRSPDGALVLTRGSGKSFTGVEVVRAAPLSQPDRYICFLDSAGEEICMIRSLGDLPPADRLLAEEELRVRYLTSVIRKVVLVRREAGTLYWDVETDRGRRELVVQVSGETVRWLRESCVHLDVDGNRFQIPDVGALSPESARRINEHLR